MILSWRRIEGRTIVCLVLIGGWFLLPQLFGNHEHVPYERERKAQLLSRLNDAMQQLAEGKACVQTAEDAIAIRRCEKKWERSVSRIYGGVRGYADPFY